MCFSGCWVQGPGERCEEGKRLFRDIEVVSQWVMNRYCMITPTTQDQDRVSRYIHALFIENRNVGAADAQALLV
jgi:hypothetical protein